MSKFDVGDLVSLHDKRLTSISPREPLVGVVMEIRDLEYVEANACMTVITVLFGNEKLTLSENDFVLMRGLNEKN
jgi:hypothetical protein